MNPAEKSQPLRDVLSSLVNALLSTGQAGLVTVLVFAAATFIFKNGCACSTKAKAYQAAMKSDLRNLTSAQEAYFANYQGYASTTEALGDSWRPSTGVSITIDEWSTFGWKASATHPGTPARCSIFVGTLNLPPDPGIKAVEGQPVCVGGRRR